MTARKLVALSVVAFATGALVVAQALVGGRPQPGPVSPAGGPPAGTTPPLAGGWVDDPAAVREAAARLGCGRFRDTEAFGAAAEAGPEDVFLWEACRRVTGDVLPARDQGAVGACVGFATAAAVEHLLCAQIDAGSGEAFRPVAPEVVYGGARVEVGGGRLAGDGCVGGWAAVWVSEYGVVPRGVLGRHDLRLYDEGRCREFGRLGARELAWRAREHPVGGVANVRSWDECRAAVRAGCPVVVCSSQGFGVWRDADGFCPPRGAWYHAMAVVGVRGGRRPGAFLLNSWGPDAHPGPRYPPDAPPGGFWADAAVVDGMLAQGDSWALGRAAGFRE